MKALNATVLFVSLSVACGSPAAPPASTNALPAAVPLAPAPPLPEPSAIPGDAGSAGAVLGELPAVLARVNGEAIERWEFEYVVRGVENQAGRAIPDERRDEVYRSILTQMVAHRLLAQEARARRLQASQADVDARIDQFRKTFPSEKAFSSALASEGMTVENLRERTRQDLLVSRILEVEIGPKLQLQPSEIEAFYKQNLDRFKQGEAVHASHILIAIPESADAAEKQRRRAEAEALLKQVRGGASFADLARTRSQDTSSAARGGDLGLFSAGQMDPALEKAVFALKPGEISQVVETPYGFHIIQLHERRPAKVVPLEEARAEIQMYLTGQRREELTAALVERLKEKGKVELYV